MFANTQRCGQRRLRRSVSASDFWLAEVAGGCLSAVALWRRWMAQLAVRRMSTQPKLSTRQICKCGLEFLEIGRSLSFFLVLFFMTGCGNSPVYFQSQAVSGTVVDKQTGQPLPDVSVTVRWAALHSTGNEHNPDCIDIKLFTTVTDSNGLFIVPAWGPVTLYGSWHYFVTEPEVSFTKSGQFLGSANNDNYKRKIDWQVEVDTSPFQKVTFEKPSWNGQKIPM